MTLEAHLALAGLGDRRVLDQLEHLRAAERGDRDRAHRGPHATVPRLMSLTVVGSIAFDAVETQIVSRDRLLGGSAVLFSLASSFFDDTRVVGPVGDDFGDAEYERCTRAASLPTRSSTSPRSSFFLPVATARRLLRHARRISSLEHFPLVLRACRSSWARRTSESP